MSLRFDISALSLVASATLTVGCSDNRPQGGGQTGHDGSECDETVTVLASKDAPSPLGFTGAAVLAYSVGSFETPIEWVDNEMAGYGPEHGAGTLTVGVSYAAGQVRFVESHEKPDGAEEDDIASFGNCRNRLEVDVDMTIETAGGALDEAISATLRAEDARWAVSSSDLDLAALGGSFAPTPEPGFVAVGLSIEAGFSVAGNTFGTVTGVFGLDGGQDNGRGFASYAHWPSAATCTGDVVLPLDATLFAFTAQDAAALASASAPASLTWSAGGTTELTLDLAPATDVACAVLSSGPELGQGIAFEAVLHAVSDDGRIDGDIPVLVHATAGADGALEAVTLLSSGSAHLTGVPPAEFESTYGVSGFDLSAYDQASLDVTGTFAPDGAGASVATGRMAVMGLTLADCSNEPGSACEGTQSVEVGTADWQ
jgi:hypothetical protein